MKTRGPAGANRIAYMVKLFNLSLLDSPVMDIGEGYNFRTDIICQTQKPHKFAANGDELHTYMKIIWGE